MRDTKIGSAPANRDGCEFFSLEQDDVVRKPLTLFGIML
jgi:hypothetical protein